MRLAIFQVTISMRPPRRQLASSGFTLFELVAVLAVLAVLAGAVMFSVRSHVSNAQLESFLDRLEDFDGHARADARRRGQATAFLFDLEERNVTQIGSDRSMAVPLGVEIARIRTISQESDHGVLQVGVSPFGQTDTYALQLRASGGRSVWFVALGVSGQCLRFDKEIDVDEVFLVQLAAPRGNAG